MEWLDAEGGIDFMVEKMREYFGEPSGHRKQKLLIDHGRLRRMQGEAIHAYCLRYRRTEAALMQNGIDVVGTCDGQARGHHLLERTMLGPDGRRQVVTMVSDDFTFSKIAKAFQTLHPENRAAPPLVTATGINISKTPPCGGGRCQGGRQQGGRSGGFRQPGTNHESSVHATEAADSEQADPVPVLATEDVADETVAQGDGQEDGAEMEADDMGDAEEDDVGEEVQATIDEANEILSVIVKKLKNITQGRQWTKKAAGATGRGGCMHV